MALEDSKYPFYFAIPHDAPRETRAGVPSHVATTYGVPGRVEFVGRDEQLRLYRIVKR